MKTVASMLVLAACVAVLLRSDLPGQGRFERVGTNPWASVQPTPVGRRLHTLEGWRHELFVGYGDWTENTGPIEVSAYDPALGTFSSKLTFATEAIENYRPIGERLYAPAIDPLGGGQSASVAIGEPDGRWWNNKNVHVTHAFDIATLDGTDLWLAGARHEDAIVVRSVDRGETWTTSLLVGQHDPKEEDFARFYFIFAHRGRLYVQAEDYAGGLHPRSKVFDGTAWTDGPDLAPRRGGGAKPMLFADRVVYRGGHGLTVFDGTSVRSLGVSASDLKVADGVLYALSDGVIRATVDLATWSTVAVAPAGTISIGLLDGILYAGTARSQLYRFSRPLAPVRSGSREGPWR